MLRFASPFSLQIQRHIFDGASLPSAMCNELFSKARLIIPSEALPAQPSLDPLLHPMSLNKHLKANAHTWKQWLCTGQGLRDLHMLRRSLLLPALSGSYYHHAHFMGVETEAQGAGERAQSLLSCFCAMKGVRAHHSVPGDLIPKAFLPDSAQRLQLYSLVLTFGHLSRVPCQG